MQVGEAGDEEFASRVEDAEAGWNRDAAGRADGENVLVRDEDGGVGLRRRAGGVNDGGVGNGEGRGFRRAAGQAEEK